MLNRILMKGIFVGAVLLMAAGLASAQSFTKINPPPCDFSDQFYKVNGILTSNTATQTAELAAEPDGRFGTFRQTGPPATGTQVNWVADTPNCSATDPTRRDFRILATTGGNADDGNSPFTCADPNFAVPACSSQPTIPETLEFISILAFLHKQDTSFETSFTTSEGDNPISITPGKDAAGNVTGLNPRGISMEYIVGNFEAYASVGQFVDANGNPIGKANGGKFAPGPCSAQMNAPNPVPTPCFKVADTTDANNNTISDVATPKLRQNWRFATNRNAVDGSDNNCITQNDQLCKHKGTFSDSPFGYFCDDLLGMWIITYFWFSQPPDTAVEPCKDIFAAIGAKNGFNLDGTPVILTAHELNDELEANGCGAEGQEAFDGSDGGAVWLVCPAIPDPRNGAIASDAFLDVVTHSGLLDPFISNNFSCLQSTGKFCFETSVE
ncbi:MAG TPA: hypothetical protein VI431_17150 [Candidatus Acidoferrum sp.]